MGKNRILICVEGEKNDVHLMRKLFELYEIDDDYEIVSYRTNIYKLYDAMFADGTPEDMDLLQVLKEREPDVSRKNIFDEKYSDVLLVFDMDPQDPYFSGEKLKIMTEFFTESTDQGRLYINYPMVESFYHMKSVPDEAYYSRTVDLSILKERKYKALVRKEGRGYTPRAVYSVVIKQNIEKAWRLIKSCPKDGDIIPSLHSVLVEQINFLEKEQKISVLCCCVFFIAEYDYKLLQ